MNVISEQDLHDEFDPVMNAVEAGETYRITRDGVEIAELRPLQRRRPLTAEELVEHHKRLPG